MVPGGSGRARAWDQQLSDQRLGSRIQRPRRGADHLSAEAMRGLAVAQLMSNRGDPGWTPAQGTIARAQTRLALVRAKIDAKRAVSTRVHSWCAMGTRRQVTTALSSPEDGDWDVEDLQ